MTPLDVWAPRARSVAVALDDAELAMRPAEGRGWWTVDVPAPEGARYAYRLDGGDLLPDPRSPSQPDGVDGRSEVVDHDCFEWRDQRWPGISLHGAVLYECHVGTFSREGTFDGAITMLDHLVDLGVTVIELMPIAEFPGRHGWGYDGANLFAPHHAYGGPSGLKRLVDACHDAGIGVLLDVVYNHLGPSGNHLATFGPYFTDEHTTGWGAAINFEGDGSFEVRRFVVDNACSWVRDYHVDGLRLDAIHAITDRSAVHVLEELAREVGALATQLGRSVVVIAECDRNDPRVVRSVEVGGYGLHAAWADDWHHALHVALTSEHGGYYADFSSTDLPRAITSAWVYDGRYSALRDATRGRPADGLDGAHFVVSVQNHDQVGNRALGERLSALTTIDRCKLAAALLCTSPFVPLLFQGEEWAASTPFLYFTDHAAADVAAAVTSGRREEFPELVDAADHVPDPQASSTFAASVLRWEERTEAPHHEMLAWYRDLLALRRARPELGEPDLSLVTARLDADGLLVVERGSLQVIANLGSTVWVADHDVEVLLASVPIAAPVELPPDSVAIVVPRR